MSSFEEIFNKLGGFSKAQIIYTCLLTATKCGLGWSMIQMTFSGIIPDWYCITEDSNTLVPTNYSETSLASTFKVCEVNGTKCKSYFFDSSISTIINEWGLVCDLRWVKATVISVQMGGVLAGCIAGGFLGDQFGRKKSVYSLILFNIAVNVVTAFSNSWMMFAVLRFFCGCGLGGTLVVILPYSMEFVPLKWRSVLGNLPFWVIGCMGLALGAHLTPNWSHLHLLNAIVFAPCLLGWFIVPESIRWLAVKGRVDEAYENFEDIARRNGIELPGETKGLLEAIARHEREMTSRKKYTYLDLFKDRQIATFTAIFCFQWFSMSIIFYGISFAVSSFSGNFSVNLAAMLATSLPFMPVVPLAMNKFGRKATTVFFFMVACVSAIGCLILEMMGPFPNRGTWINCLAMLARLAADLGWTVVMTWGTELYPTVTRNLGYGAHNASARLGGMFAPFLINLDDMVVASYLTIAGLSLLIVLTSFVPPETKNRVLADSMVIRVTREREHELNKSLIVVKPHTDPEFQMEVISEKQREMTQNGTGEELAVSDKQEMTTQNDNSQDQMAADKRDVPSENQVASLAPTM